MRAKREWGSEDGAMEEQDRFGVRVGGMSEVEDIAVVAQAAEDRGTRRGGNREAVRADGDFAIIVDADVGLEAPDIRPPRAGRGGA